MTLTSKNTLSLGSLQQNSRFLHCEIDLLLKKTANKNERTTSKFLPFRRDGRGAMVTQQQREQMPVQAPHISTQSETMSYIVRQTALFHTPARTTSDYLPTFLHRQYLFPTVVGRGQVKGELVEAKNNTQKTMSTHHHCSTRRSPDKAHHAPTARNKRHFVSEGSTRFPQNRRGCYLPPWLTSTTRAQKIRQKHSFGGSR